MFVIFLDFSLEAYMKQQGLNAVDQLKGLALDKLKEALGLPTYLNDPPCSLTDSKYTPNTNGIKKGNSHRLLSQINLTAYFVCSFGMMDWVINGVM